MSSFSPTDTSDSTTATSGSDFTNEIVKNSNRNETKRLHRVFHIFLWLLSIAVLTLSCLVVVLLVVIFWNFGGVVEENAHEEFSYQGFFHEFDTGRTEEFIVSGTDSLDSTKEHGLSFQTSEGVGVLHTLSWVGDEREYHGTGECFCCPSCSSNEECSDISTSTPFCVNRKCRECRDSEDCSREEMCDSVLKECVSERRMMKTIRGTRTTIENESVKRSIGAVSCLYKTSTAVILFAASLVTARIVAEKRMAEECRIMCSLEDSNYHLTSAVVEETPGFMISETEEENSESPSKEEADEKEKAETNDGPQRRNKWECSGRCTSHPDMMQFCGTSGPIELGDGKTLDPSTLPGGGGLLMLDPKKLTRISDKCHTFSTDTQYFVNAERTEEEVKKYFGGASLNGFCEGHIIGEHIPPDDPIVVGKPLGYTTTKMCAQDRESIDCVKVGEE